MSDDEELPGPAREAGDAPGAAAEGPPVEGPGVEGRDVDGPHIEGRAAVPIEGFDALDAGDLGDSVLAPVEGPYPEAEASTRRLAGATAGMAVGTTLSRLTGVGRIIAMTAALAGGGFADAYNLANTTPNIITDIVIGGVLAATFVPVFVSNLSTRPAEEAWEAISAVVTATIALLAAATVVFFVLTPTIIDLYTVTNHHADVVQQQQTAIFLLRWFVPQLACYGLIALFSALLNTQGRFAAPMFVPIANNVVVIVVLVWFHALVPHPDLASIQAHRSALVLLAFGTTLGVVVQAALLVPSLLRAGLHLRVRWQPRHEAVRRVASLAGWTFGIVLCNQVALVVVLALADGARVPGAVSAYTYAYTFFQLPYGIIAVSVMSAVTPSLSSRWATGDLAAFRHRMAFGLRSILAIIIPAAVGMIVLSHPLIDLVLAHGAETPAQASTTAATLAVLCLGLPGFCTLLYLVRVLQAMHDTRTAFRIYIVENVINIVLAVVLVGPLGVEGLALAFSLAYTAGAAVALVVVRRREGGLGGSELTTPVLRVVVATAVMGIASVVTVSLSGASSGFALLVRVVATVVVGVMAFGATTVAMAVWEERRRGRAGPGRGPGERREDTRASGADPASSGAPDPAAPDDGSATDMSAAPPHGGRPAVRLLPAPSSTGGGEGTEPDGTDDQPDGEGFRGRLAPVPRRPAFRLLRSAPADPADAAGEGAGDPDGPGAPRPAESGPADDGEESHGQDPDRHR